MGIGILALSLLPNIKNMDTMIEKNKKSGPLYLKWYKLKSTSGVCGRWEDYDNFVSWYKLWTSELGTEDVVFIQTKGQPLSPSTLKLIRRDDVDRYNRFSESVRPKWRRLLKTETVCAEWKEFSTFLDWYMSEWNDGGRRILRKFKGAAGPDTIILGHNPTREMVDTYNKVARRKKMAPEWSGKDGRQVFYYWMQDVAEMDTNPLFCTDTAGVFTHMNSKHFNPNDKPEWISDKFLTEAFNEFKSMCYGADKLDLKIYDDDCDFWPWLDNRKNRFIG